MGVGRVIRSKLDYGLMIFADNRYSRSDKRKKLPQWLSNYLKQEYINLSTDVAVEIATRFVKKMAQPHSKKDEIGKSLLSSKDIERKIKKYESENVFEQEKFNAVGIVQNGNKHRQQSNH